MREEEAQAEALSPAPQQLLHGREVPWLLQDYHRVQPCPDCRRLCWVLHCSVSANRRKSQVDRGLQFQEEATLNFTCLLRELNTTLDSKCFVPFHRINKLLNPTCSIFPR